MAITCYFATIAIHSHLAPVQQIVQERLSHPRTFRVQLQDYDTRQQIPLSIQSFQTTHSNPVEKDGAWSLSNSTTQTIQSERELFVGATPGSETGNRAVLLIHETSVPEVVEIDYRFTFLRGASGDFVVSGKSTIRLGEFAEIVARTHTKNESGAITLLRIEEKKEDPSPVVASGASKKGG